MTPYDHSLPAAWKFNPRSRVPQRRGAGGAWHGRVGEQGAPCGLCYLLPAIASCSVAAWRSLAGHEGGQSPDSETPLTQLLSSDRDPMIQYKHTEDVVTETSDIVADVM